MGRLNWAFGAPLALALLAVPAGAADVAVRAREDGRVDVRAQAAPLVSVLDRLASETGLKVMYQGLPPRRTVSLEVYGANQAEAVMEVLAALGADYAVAMDPAGARVLTVVVAGTEPASSSLPDSIEPDAPAPQALPGSVPDDVEPTGDTSASTGDTYAPLTGDFVPGGRATGQPSEWGVPAFVMPDPPDVAEPVDPRSTTPAGEPEPEPESEPAPMPTPALTPAPHPALSR